MRLVSALVFRVFVSDQCLNNALHAVTYRCEPCPSERTMFVFFFVRIKGVIWKN
ncbi:hypothetical protein JG688_00001523 [Phytophthora aleatoria]|uniref:Uncharacterized protein n=1 Tax=Phytophthora aleatoria TaxID=2496075 RepID=A0A8J5J427_9STRA|nr:hypothetical protein JG688_00001523 [Phytophthora aleatoria]